MHLLLVYYFSVTVVRICLLKCKWPIHGTTWATCLENLGCPIARIRLPYHTGLVQRNTRQYILYSLSCGMLGRDGKNDIKPPLGFHSGFSVRVYSLRPLAYQSQRAWSALYTISLSGCVHAPVGQAHCISGAYSSNIVKVVLLFRFANH